MSDRDEISRLLCRYAECIDTGNFDGVGDLFVHGEFHGADLVRRGRDEVRQIYDGVILYEGVPRTHHVITNVVIDVADGADEATSSCYLTLQQKVDSQDPVETILSARYIDTFRRIAGGWEFAERRMVADMVGDLSRHYAQPA